MFTKRELSAIQDGLRGEADIDPNEDDTFPARIETANLLLIEIVNRLDARDGADPTVVIPFDDAAIESAAVFLFAAFPEHRYDEGAMRFARALALGAFTAAAEDQERRKPGSVR